MARLEGRPAYCSHACHGIGQTGASNPSWDGGRVQITCAQCGQPHSMKRNQALKGSVHFCGRACKDEYDRLHPHRYHDLQAPCSFCGATIKITERMVGKRRFCSRTCANLSHSVLIKGQGNPRYLHGHAENKYPAEFHRLRPEIRKRDGYQCRVCGMTTEQHGSELPVHHIDFERTHNVESNLITLCKWCHGKMHGRPASRAAWQRRLLLLLSESPSPNGSTTSA
jgi:5-methylcytosine-specific restriction endonuclease McrA